MSLCLTPLKITNALMMSMSQDKTLVCKSRIGFNSNPMSHHILKQDLIFHYETLA